MAPHGPSRHTDIATADAQRVGCVGFMSPETYREQPCTAAIDVFSLGVMLHVLLRHVRHATHIPRQRDRSTSTYRRRRCTSRAELDCSTGSDALPFLHVSCRLSTHPC